MMKNQMLFLILFSTLCFSQSKIDTSDYKIRYHFTFVSDTLNPKNVISEPMVLLTNGTKSIYFSENYFARLENIKKQMRQKSIDGVTLDFRNLPVSKIKHSVFKDKEEVLVSNYIGRDFFSFKVPVVKSWQVDPNATKVIVGYLCKKATANVNGRVYSAWFTPDIPITDGPYKFSNLPGLILELREKNDYSVFEAISIEKVKLPIVRKAGTQVTREQFLSKRKEYMENPSEGKITSPSYKAYLKKMSEKNNHSLE